MYTRIVNENHVTKRFSLFNVGISTICVEVRGNARDRARTQNQSHHHGADHGIRFVSMICSRYAEYVPIMQPTQLNFIKNGECIGPLGNSQRSDAF